MVFSIPVTEIALLRVAMTSEGSYRLTNVAFILPTSSSIEIKLVLPSLPNVKGNSVSSIEIGDTPADSSSSTVCYTFKALPYPLSASTTIGRLLA